MRQAFTLIELAIVLVVIALLVGGIFVGQDLIYSARINSLISALENANQGASTFRTKYSGIPGDIVASKAQAAGLTVSATNPGASGEGDGNGILENGTASGAARAGLGGENTLFWRQLTDAQMVNLTASTADGSTIDTTSFDTTALASLKAVLPNLKIRDGAYLAIGAVGGLNYYFISSFAATGDASGTLTEVPTLTAREAIGLDSKIDDGYPDQGVVLSSNATTGGAAPSGGGTPASTNTVCYDNSATPGIYASGSTLVDTVRCALRVRSQF